MPLINNFVYKLNNIRWWVFHRFHPSHRYNILKTGLKPGYYDKDYLLQIIILKILIDFVEDEKPFEHFDTTSDEAPHKVEWVKIRELYEKSKKLIIDKDEENFDDPDRYDEITDHLIEIVKLRKMLWT